MSIKSLFQLIEDEGGDVGGDAFGGEVEFSTPLDKTGASSVAPIDLKFFKNKPIIRRIRDFTKKSKFVKKKLAQLESFSTVSIPVGEFDIRELTEIKTNFKIGASIREGSINFLGPRENLFAMLSELYCNASDALVLLEEFNGPIIEHEIFDTTPPAEKVNPHATTKFTNAMYDPKLPLTGELASTLVNKAQDEAENGEDTVAYGLELTDGEIVKVFVAVDHAEKTEQILAALIGKEEDVEKIIDFLADEVDVVSVEYPEDREAINNAVDADKEHEEDNQDVIGDEGREFKLGFELYSKEKKDDETDDKKTDDKKDKKETEEPKDDEEEEQSDELDLEDTLGDEEEVDDEEDNEEDKDKEDDVEDNEEDKTKKKKKKKKKDTDKDEEDNEEDKLKTKDKKEVKESSDFSLFQNLMMESNNVSFAEIFPTPLQQKLAKLILLLKFPVEHLLLKKHQVRQGIKTTAFELNGNSLVKTQIEKLIHQLSSIEGNSLSKQETKMEKSFKQKDLSEDTNEHHHIHDLTILIMEILFQLGVPESVLRIKQTSVKQDIRKLVKKIITLPKLRSDLVLLHKLLTKAESVEVISEQIDSYSPDPHVSLVISLAMQLGIPPENLNYRKNTVIKSIKSHKISSTLRTRLIGLINFMEQNPVTEELNEDLEQEYRKAKKTKWTMIINNKQLVMKNNDTTFFINTSFFSNLKRSLENGFSVEVNGAEFKAVDHGNEYIISNEKYPNGFILSTNDIEQLLQKI